MRALGTVVILALMMMAFAIGRQSTRADSTTQSATADVCELVATAGNITVRYCEPDVGPSFLINSVGFMALEP